MEPTDPRQICQRCLRPRGRCVCRHLEGLSPVQTRTEVVVVQHPRERFHPLGTAPLVHQGLANARLEVAWDLCAEVAVSPGTGLLYPGPDARPLEGLPPEERPPALILLDGTWPQARKLYKRNGWLARLPAFRLTPAAPGRYRIRGEPDDHALSTVEAAIQALCLLEPEACSDLEQLMAAFDRMIDQQVQLMEERNSGGRRRMRYPPPRPLHATLLRERRRLVLTYVEMAQGQLVQVAGVRPETGETLDLLFRPEAEEIEPWLLEHMGLDPAELASAPRAEVSRQRWSTFAGSNPMLTAWNRRSLDLTRRMAKGPPGQETVQLKAAYCNLGRGNGALDKVVVREKLQPPELAVRGRAGERLAMALAVLRWLLDLR